MQIAFYTPSISSNRLENIRCVRLTDCKIVELPNWILSCKNLQRLTIEDAVLNGLRGVGTLKCLKSIELCNVEIGDVYIKLYKKMYPYIEIHQIPF